MKLDERGLEAAQKEMIERLRCYIGASIVDAVITAYLSAVEAAEPRVKHGPYGYLIKPHGLNEEHWRLSDDPSEFPDEETSIPLYAAEEQKLGEPSHDK